MDLSEDWLVYYMLDDAVDMNDPGTDLDKFVLSKKNIRFSHCSGRKIYFETDGEIFTVDSGNLKTICNV